jgi:hypothetical protein
MDLNTVLPLIDIVIILKVLCNVLKVLVAACGSIVFGGGLEDAVLAVAEATCEGQLGAKLCSCSTAGKGLHPVCLLGMGAVGAFSGE